MIKQIYTTGQAIQKELNRLYPKEHENFVSNYVDFVDDERSEEWFIFDINKLQRFIEYIEKQGVEKDCNGEQRDYFWEEFSTMCERVIKIMELHKIDAVNILDKTESKPVLLDVNIKDLNDYNASNTNFIEVQNYFCYLPERAKELINKHIDEDNCSNYYTEYTYDVGGKYFLNDGTLDADGDIEEGTQKVYRTKVDDDNSEPSETQIEAWKCGEIDLYNSYTRFRVFQLVEHAF